MHRIALIALMFIAGCAQLPEGVEAVDGFEVDRYLGQWYEIARLDHPFERGLENITATYAPGDDGTIDVLNRGYDVAKGEWREARGRARFAGPPDRAMLEVSFFGPFYGGYNVIELDPDYQLALVSGPTRSYLWILSRRPDPPREAVDRLVERARELGFATDALIYVKHDRS
ncbi:MAG: lipocalin [Lysobacterales bacterium]|jgi:apolipoprotein D and lipocalin family protein|nr:MAG: lipocalin [Xanthomonadales bacterium]